MEIKKQRMEGRKPSPEKAGDREDWILLCPRCEAVELTMDDSNHRAVRCLCCGHRWMPVEA
jgi:hypothetical protein